MRLPLLCFLVLSLCTCVRAQETADYMPFRPHVNYLFDNPIPAPDWTTVTPLRMPYVGVSGISEGFDPLNEGLNVLLPAGQEGVYTRAPHFAGYLREETEPGVMVFHANTTQFELHYGASVGSTWAANEALTCTVDKIVVENFLGVTDSVKYITTRHSDGTVYPEVKISKHYGLLQGIYFTIPALMENLFTVRSIAHQWDYAIGEEFAYPSSIASVESNDEYYELLEKPTVENGVEGTRITQRIFRNKFFDRCDPLFGGYELLFRVREVSFFQPADGGENRDSIVSPSRNEYSIIPYIVEGFYEYEWAVPAMGTFIFNEFSGEDNDVVIAEPSNHDCYGPGLQQSQVLHAAASGVYHLSSTVPSVVPELHRSLAWQTERYDEEMQAVARLVGVNTHLVTCGTQFDFDALYTSTSSFPDDPLITLAPNPATDRVMVSVPFEHGSVALEIFDASGRLLRTTSATGGDRWLNVTDYSAGVYTIVLRNDAGPVARRRVVVR